MRKITRNIKVLSVFLFLFHAVTALGIDGNDWVEAEGTNSYMDHYLDGYLRGYFDGKQKMVGYVKFQLEIKEYIKLVKNSETGYGFLLWSLDNDALNCMKNGVSYGQIQKIVDKYINNHPEKLHKRLDEIVDAAIKESEVAECDTRNYSDEKIKNYISDEKIKNYINKEKEVISFDGAIEKLRTFRYIVNKKNDQQTLSYISNNFFELNGVNKNDFLGKIVSYSAHREMEIMSTREPFIMMKLYGGKYPNVLVKYKMVYEDNQWLVMPFGFVAGMGKSWLDLNWRGM